MKVVAFNGSPRVGGNTEQAIKLVFDELQKYGIETELVQLGGRKVYGCLACGKCREKKDNRCVRTDDEMNTVYSKNTGGRRDYSRLTRLFQQCEHRD